MSGWVEIGGRGVGAGATDALNRVLSSEPPEPPLSSCSSITPNEVLAVDEPAISDLTGDTLLLPLFLMLPADHGLRGGADGEGGRELGEIGEVGVIGERAETADECQSIGEIDSGA